MGASVINSQALKNHPSGERFLTSQAAGKGAPVFKRIWAIGPTEAALLFAFTLALAWAPLWMGSDGLLAWAINAIVFPSLALVLEVSLLLRGRPHPFSLWRLAIPAALFALVLLWILFQMSPLVPDGWRHPGWAMASGELGRPLVGAISVNPDHTARALLRLITAVSALWVSIQLCRDTERAYFLLNALFWIVAVYACYGLVVYAFKGGEIFPPEVDSGLVGLYVHSTFINRNSFATYAGLGLMIGVGLILRHYRRETPSGGGSRRHRLARLIEITGHSGWPLLALALIILVSLLGSLSRGGIAAGSLGLVALFSLSAGRQGTGGIARLEATLLLAAVAGGVAMLFGDMFFSRIAAEGFADPQRPAVYAIAMRSILDSPVLGFGYGCFLDAFPLYRDQSIATEFVWDRAHNTYVEVLQGLGLVFGAFLLFALAFLVHLCVRGALTRRRDAIPSAIAAACGVLVAFHSLVDFSLQIQAIGLTFMAVLGVGVAQSVSSTELVSD